MEKMDNVEGIGQIRIIKKAGNRHVRIRVNGNAITVSAPLMCSDRRIAGFIAQNAEWIRKAIKRQQTMSENAARTLSCIQPPQEWNLTASEKEVLKSDNPDIETIRDIAKRVLIPRTAELAGKMGLTYNGITIKNNRSNWGSCSSGKNINLNMHLVRLPGHLVDYIIIHELCHLVHMNHGKEFHSMMARLTGGREKELAAQVRKFAPILKNRENR